MVLLPRKKTAAEVQSATLAEPDMTEEDWRDYREGWRLFNERQFWHAHEAWESVWRRRPEDSRIFFQGIIQLAAAYHLLVVKKRYGGTMKNLEKAEEKLKLFRGRYLRADVDRLLQAISEARGEIAGIGQDHLDRFDLSIIPALTCEV
jgi:predicted metal-dependent hydrolase